MSRIIVVGSYGVGLTMTMRRAPAAGETVHGRTFASGPGGKGSNQAIAMARLGAQVSLCTVVGSDDYGRAARALWAAENVDADLVQTLDGSTMVGLILVEDGGENRIAIAPGVLADFHPDLLDGVRAALPGTDLLVVGLEIPVATAHAALQLAREHGVPTVLNPAPAPAAALPAELLALVDHLTPNRTEAAMLAGLPVTTDPRRLLESDALAAVPTLVLTLGGEGALMRSAGTVSRLAAIPVRPVDTTGAGDCFTAAYAVRVAEGDPPEAAARYACRAAAHSVRIEQVVPSLPYARDLAHVLAASNGVSG